MIESKCRKKYAAWALFLLLDVMIVAGIGELWVRMFIPVKNICYYVDQQIGVRYCPNQRTYGHVQENYSNIAVTNEYGFHDVERSKQKQDGIYRIQLYGDSMIAGMGVGIEETIPWLLEAYLNAHSGERRFEVLNMAAGTDATNGQVMTYATIGKTFEADMVICHFMDDFGDNIIEISQVKHAPYFEFDADQNLTYIPPVPKETDSFIGNFKRKWCKLYRLLANKVVESRSYYQYTVLKRKLGVILSGSTVQDQTDYDTMLNRLYVDKGWPVTLAVIEKFNEMVIHDGRTFILSDGRVFDGHVGSVYTNTDLERFCDNKGIPYLPVYREMERLSKAPLEDYFFIDGHPTTEGNRRIAKKLGDEILQYLQMHGAKETAGNIPTSHLSLVERWR